MRPRETPDLQRWREASCNAVAEAQGAADLFTDFLAAGGPDAIKSLKATTRKLQAQLEEQRADGRLERYRKLQKDLEECDKVRASLRNALLSCKWTEDEVDAHIQKKLFKASTLYGASREMLLRENRLLRSQLEEHLLTSRTIRLPAGAASPSALGWAAVPDSTLKQARMMQGPHMEAVAHLRKAAGALDAAERSFRLPFVRHAEAQADDGSLVAIRTLQQQLGTVAGQKLQLLQQVGSLTEQGRVLGSKLEAAGEQLAEMRRQKTDMLAHRDNLSKELREHLVSETKRADAAEVALAEARAVAAATRESEAAAVRSMEAALAEARAMQAALQEKSQQVDTLRGLYLELREALERLAGDVGAGQKEAAGRLLDATREQLRDQRALLEDVKSSAADAQQAAQRNTETVSQLVAAQRELAVEVVTSGRAAVATLGAYERQLGVTQQLLQQSEADRVRLARQAIAASALNRLEDKRHERAARLLLREMPQSVVRRIAPALHALAEGTEQLAAELEATNNTLAEAGVLGGVSRNREQELLHAPMVPDEVDDATTQLLANSRHLRAQLTNLSPADPPGNAPRQLRPREPVPDYEYDYGAKDGDNGFGAELGAHTNIGLGATPENRDLRMPLLTGMYPVVFEDGGIRAVPVVNQAAAEGPYPTMLPAEAGPPPPLFGPPGYAPWAPAPPRLLLPAGFAAPFADLAAGPAYVVPPPVVVLRPPARLDMVLQLPPEEPPPSPQQPPESGAAPPLATPPPGQQQQQQVALPEPPGGPQAKAPGGGPERADAVYAGPMPACDTKGAGGTVAATARAAAGRGGAAGAMPPAGLGAPLSDAAALRADQLPAKVDTGRDRASAAPADAVSHAGHPGMRRPADTSSSGPADGESLPATVWTPSPALLEAFEVLAVQP